MDSIEQFKENQKQAWKSFASLEMFTSLGAPALVRFASVASGAKVLDVGCGTGVVAIHAATKGARVTGVDLTPELIEHAKANTEIAGVSLEWRVGDAEALPFADGSFDVVLSQFGHMFAPRPEVAVAEMLRVLRPGGVVAFSTWPPELFTGRFFALNGRYAPPPPPGIAPPTQWGDPNVVRARLGEGVRDVRFDRSSIMLPAVSARHVRPFMEANMGPLARLVKMLASEPEKLAAFRRDIDALVEEYFEDNRLRQDFLMSRATKLG